MKKSYIIAEIGINHNGDINLAKELINSAKVEDNTIMLKIKIIIIMIIVYMNHIQNY